MVGSFIRLAAAAVFSCLLAGCAGGPDRADFETSANGASVETPDKPIQCVPYARAHSGIDIRGDAYTWWDQAAGRFARGASPSEGAVLVLAGYAGPSRAHLAVVSKIVSPREIHVDHANWLDDGAIYVDDPVVDVSALNDWSQVRVWNIRTGGWGARTYPVQGFIGPGPGGHGDLHVADAGGGDDGLSDDLADDK
jgi:hypothetical protein